MRFDTQLSFISACLCGVLIVVVLVIRRRPSLSDWACVLGFAALGAEQVFAGLSAQAGSPSLIVQWQSWKLMASAIVPGIWLLFSLTYARGNALEFLRGWRFFLFTAFALPLSLTTIFYGSLFLPLQVPDAPTEATIIPFGWAGLALYLVILAASVLVMMNLERTFRASVGTMRWRIKFMLMGVGILFVVRIYSCTQALLFLGVDRTLQGLDSAALWIGAVLILRALFRDRQSSADIYPSHSVLQGSFTVLLVGAYLLVVGLFAKVVAYLGGDASFALKAFVVLILVVMMAVVMQSERAKLHFRRFLSRNFSRPSHDYRAVWRNFTEGTATKVEQVELCRALAKLVAETFQSLSVSVWLIGENRETLVLAASTFLSEGHEQPTAPEHVAGLIAHFQAAAEPVDLEAYKGDWAEMLRTIHPVKFTDGGGHRICLPLQNGGAFLGLITIGDRVGGAPFSTEDYDMLVCVGGHAASSILSTQLSNKLLMVKELEAFQTMAAFFVHDLKNSASTLNLMLQNLPVHFDDPAFREDALRGVGKTVTHINHLVSRLSSLRHQLKFEPIEADFNEMVASAIAGAVGASGIRVETRFSAVGKVPVDREQLAKVVTNLVLNAVEASPANGPVRVSTRQDGSWAVLAVSDEGCGMSADFLRRSLYRPFQTTKKNGLGIGMFQSKMIVESHGGRIAVSSEIGRGTTFQVFIPNPSPIS